MSPIHPARLLAILCLCPGVAVAQNDRADEAFQVGIGMQQRGLHDEAVRQFQRFLQRGGNSPQAAEANYRMAVSLVELQNGNAAKGAFAAALQAGGQGFTLRAECRYRYGNLLQADKDLKAARAQFQMLLEEVAADHYLRAGAGFALGECARDLGDDGGAALAFAAAAKAATGDQQSFRFPALYQLGFCLVRSEQLPQAADAFALAVQAAPDAEARCECSYLRGDALLRAGRHDDAAAAFAAAIAGKGEFADDAAFGLGFAALGKDDGKAAEAAFTRVLREFPTSPLGARSKLELGRLLYRRGDHAGALAALTGLDHEDVEAAVQKQARELAGLCSLAGGDGERAVASLQQALRDAAGADKPRLSFALGEAFSNLARWQEAVAAYDAVPPEAPADLRGDALYGACFALHALGRREDSLQRAAALLRLEPRHRLADDAHFATAENLFELRRYADAEREYAVVAEVAAFAGRAAWKRAWCSYLGGDKAAAATRFAALAGADAKGQASEFAEEALSMQALALFETGAPDAALAAADRYRARHAAGGFLERTERVAARVLRQKGDLPGARARLERVAKAVAAAKGDASQDRLEQAELAYQAGDFAAADAIYAELAARQDALGARAIAGRAWCAFELGDDAGCAAWIGKGLVHPAVGDEAAGLYELQSASCHRQRAWPAAIAAAQAFLKAFPKHGRAPAMRYALGVAEARAGQPKAARATLQQLAKDGGHDRMDQVAYELAWACRRDGDEAAALAEFARVAEGSKDVELAGEARLHVGTAALERKDRAAAAPLLLAVQGSHRGKALYRLAFAEFEAAGQDQAQLQAARDHFAAIAAIAGEELVPEALYLGAECCQRLGDDRGAIERVERMLAAAPQHARADRARLLLGECAVRTGDGDRAVAPLELFLRGQGREVAEQVRANLALGRARALRGEHDKAEPCYVRVTDLSDGALGAEAQFRLGESRQQRGDAQGAIDSWLKLTILYADPTWVRRGLLAAGLAYEQQKAPEKAQKLFAELVQKFADSDEAKTAKTHLRND